MGGIGSGQWYRWSTKPVVEDGVPLNLNKLVRDKLVVPGAWTSGGLVWHYVHSGEKSASIGYIADMKDPSDASMRLQYTCNGKTEDYVVRLTTTTPNFGGLRWWFVCPLTGKRAAKLYLLNGASKFVSVKAYRFAYRSQNEGYADRALSKAQKIRRKLGGDWGLDAPFAKKPKGMHNKTYNRLVEQAMHYEEIGWVEAGERFGIEL